MKRLAQKRRKHAPAEARHHFRESTKGHSMECRGMCCKSYGYAIGLSRGEQERRLGWKA